MSLLVNIEDSLDLLLAEFDQTLHQLTREIFRISSDNGKITKLSDKLDSQEDSHDLRAKLNAMIETNKENVSKVSGKLQEMASKSDNLPVTPSNNQHF